MKSANLLIVFALALLLAGSAAAQPDILARLDGTWEGEGKVLGREAKITMTWAPALAGRHIRLDFVNVMPGGGRFEGTAFYTEADNGDWSGRWFDSYGAFRPINAELDKDSLTANWGTPETEEGRTVYRLLENGSLEVVDSVKGAGGWREFGRSLLRKKYDPVSTVRAFTAAYNAGDLEGMMALVHDDVAWYRIKGGEISEVTKGKKVLRESLVPYFDGERSTFSVIESVMTAGGFVTVTERVNWKDKDGNEKSQAALIVYEFADGKILTVWDYPAFK